jgi:hypothetical protein
VKVVVMGILGKTPLAGVSWQLLQYLEGFRELGCDCYYIEDTGDWAYNPELTTFEYKTTHYSATRDYAVNYVARLMASYGYGDRWAYVSRIDGQHFGMAKCKVSELFRDADVLVNVTGSTRLLDEHLLVPIRIYLETDPGLRQIQVAKGDPEAIELMNSHTHHFTYGENLGSPDCGIPVTDYDYLPSRPPVVLDWWKEDDKGSSPFGCADQTIYTTISNWVQTGKDLEWNGENYLWSKHLEFLKFIDVPKRTSQRFELALLFAIGKEPVPLLGTSKEAIPVLKSHGWLVQDAIAVSKDIRLYHDYILGSRGEFTVSKDQYVRLRSGWFSDRSACYLAAGRPVVTQCTAFDKVLPTGLGLFSFKSLEEIVAAFDAIESDYNRHCRAARELAAEYFAVEKVLSSLMEKLRL